MVVNRKKKYRKYLGARYARRGYNDRNRGGGTKGGRGMSGWRKKKHKYLEIIKKYPEILEDKKGFTSPNYNKEIRVINLGDIEEIFDKLLLEGKIKTEGDYYVLDLNELGYDKLLGRGNISRKMKIFVKNANKGAIEKVKALGGEIIVK